MFCERFGEHPSDCMGCADVTSEPVKLKNMKATTEKEKTILVVEKATSLDKEYKQEQEHSA